MEEAKEDCASKKKKTEEDLGDSRRGERRIYLLTKGCKRFGQVPLETLRDRGNLWDEKEGLGDGLWRYIVKKKRETEDPEKGRHFTIKEVGREGTPIVKKTEWCKNKGAGRKRKSSLKENLLRSER